jgi:hypothetical protein
MRKIYIELPVEPVTGNKTINQSQNEVVSFHYSLILEKKHLWATMNVMWLHNVVYVGYFAESFISVQKPYHPNSKCKRAHRTYSAFADCRPGRAHQTEHKYLYVNWMI